MDPEPCGQLAKRLTGLVALDQIKLLLGAESTLDLTGFAPVDRGRSRAGRSINLRIFRPLSVPLE